MAWFLELLIAILILVGAFFLFVGSLGLAKLPDIMRRLHAPTKATTLGIGSMLIASMLYFFAVQGNVSIHELLITLFLFLTAPVTAHMVAKAHILRSETAREQITSTTQIGWATLQRARSVGREDSGTL